MGDENPIRTLGDYSKPSYEGYRNTIELPDPSPHGRILLPDSLLNSFHREGPQNSATISSCSNNIMENRYLKHGLCEIDSTAAGKLRNKNADESWEIIENLALYDHEG
ncbi:hypothetical protein Tco_0496678 [Tanacetum coccineum]